MNPKLLSVFVLAAGLLLSGCTVEEVPVAEHTILAVMEDDQTRTSVTDGGVFSWSAGDQVWLQTTNGSVVGTLSSGAETSSAEFTYGGFVGEMTGKAVYPYNDGHSISEEVLNFVLPASYDLGTSLQNTNAALYGVNVDGTLKFNHLAGVMRFKFKNVPAGVNQFVITLDKKINGTFRADLTADYPVLETSATEVEAEKTVTFNFDALTQTSDIMIYVPLPLGTYNSLGLALNNAEKSVWTYSNTVANTIKRKKLILMPTVTLSGSIDEDLEGDGSEEEPMPEPQLGDYVDEYGINHGQGIKIGEIVWAPVNCGYHKTNYKYGKLYQWGRKYGQGYCMSYADGEWYQSYSDASVPVRIQGPVSLSEGQSEENADKFYYSYSPYNWLHPSNDELWDSSISSNPVKTEYDPCPEGWRVPTLDEFMELDNNYSEQTTDESGLEGRWFSGSLSHSSSVPRVFLPAAGYNNSSGISEGRGSCGYYWVSTPLYDHYAYRFYFNDSNIKSTMSQCRASGYSVRCVKEGAASPAPSEPEIINLSENGTANSYIVSKSGTYKFGTVKGNSSESVGAVASAEVLWESFGTDVAPSIGDLVESVSYTDDYILFTTPETYKEGNAVIAAKDASGNILWSWHIWLTDEPQGQEYYNNAGTMMDRNLGATSATPGDVGALGLLYQWGRKDPFLGSSSISESVDAKSTITWPSYVSSDSNNGTIAYATANPTTFIRFNSNNYDWYYTGSESTDNTRWTTSDKTKSIYDPCPSGWRVPDGGENGVWSKALGSSSYFKDESLYDDSNKGMNFSGKFGLDATIWYPVSGDRYNDGSLSTVGRSGWYWSTSTDSYHAYQLAFSSSCCVYPLNDGTHRASCLSVRCVRE